jgi:hypothetical protein
MLLEIILLKLVDSITDNTFTSLIPLKSWIQFK